MVQLKEIERPHHYTHHMMEDTFLTRRIYNGDLGSGWSPNFDHTSSGGGLLNGHIEHLVISLDTIIKCGDVDTCLCTSGAGRKGVGIGSICEMHQSCGVEVEVRWEHTVSCGICTHVLLHWVPLWDKL